MDCPALPLVLAKGLRVNIEEMHGLSAMKYGRASD